MNELGRRAQFEQRGVAKSPKLLSDANDSQTRAAFTLIELLVTVAIIGILASLLLPSLSRAKIAARRVQCVNHLRQITLSTSMYVSDFAAYPTYMHFGGKTEYWADLLEPYLKSKWADPVYRCPDYPWTNHPPFKLSDNGSGGIGSYDLNATGVGLFFHGMGLGGRGSGSSTISPIDESSVKAPSDMIAFGDVVITPNLTTLTGYLRVSLYVNPSYAGLRKFGKPYEAKRHRGSFNISFCDGHVETLKPQRLFTQMDDVLRRWNNDNQPHRELWGF